MSRSYGDFNELTARYAALQTPAAPPIEPVPVKVVSSTPQGCDGRIRLTNVAASSRASSACLACYRSDGSAAGETPSLSSAAQRFALVAKLQMQAIATASMPRPVRSI